MSEVSWWVNWWVNWWVRRQVNTVAPPGSSRPASPYNKVSNINGVFSYVPLHNLDGKKATMYQIFNFLAGTLPVGQEKVAPAALRETHGHMPMALKSSASNPESKEIPRQALAEVYFFFVLLSFPLSKTN